VTTPVEELRSAAVLLRQRADAAPKGPWSALYFGDRGYPQRVTNAQATLIANTYEGGTGLRPIPEYIRLMNPLVALALADLLNTIAEDMGRAGAVEDRAAGLDGQPLVVWVPGDLGPHEAWTAALWLARLVTGGGS
jgi:hypothetical protein